MRKIVLPVAPDHQPIGSIAWGVMSGRFRRLNFMLKSASEVQHAPRSTVLQAVFVAVSAAGAPRRYPSAPVAPGSEPYVQGLEHMPLYTPVPSTRVPGVLTWFYHRVAM